MCDNERSFKFFEVTYVSEGIKKWTLAMMLIVNDVV